MAMMGETSGAWMGMERTVVARRVVVGSSKRGTRGTQGTMVTRSLGNRRGS
jgi:hypothetical protein